MKTESVLSRINSILAMLEDPTPAKFELEKLGAELADQVRMEYAASRGVTSATRIIRAMLKAEQKKCNRPALQYAWIDGQGRQCVCDGFRAFRLVEALPLEERPADAGDPVDLGKVVPVISKNYAAMPLPGVNEVKAFIALEQASKGRKVTPVWDFGKGKPAVNAQYLADLLNVLPDAQEIYYSVDGKFSPLYAKSERGDALLLPVSTESKKAEYAAAKHFAALMQNYRECVAKDNNYAISPDAFALMVKYAPAV